MKKQNLPYKNSFFSSITFRLILVIAIIVLLFSSVGIVITLSNTKKQLTKVILEQQLIFSKYISNNINIEIRKNTAFITHLANELSAIHSTSDSFVNDKLIQEIETPHIFKNGVSIISPDGKRIIYEHPVIPGRKDLSFVNSAWFQRATVTNKAIISNPFNSRISHEPSIVFAAPIKNNKNQLIAVVACELNLNHPDLFEHLYNSSIGSRGRILVISPADKLFIASSIPKMVMKPTPKSGENELHDRAMNGYRGVGVTVNVLGIEELSAITSIESTGWFVVVRLPTSEAYQPVKQLSKTLIIYNLLLTFIILLIIMIALIIKLAPLKNAAFLVKKMANGSLPIEKLTLVHKDEVGDFIDGFNSLVDTIDERTAKLETSNIKLENSFKEIKVLQGILPICSFCKNIRNDDGYYERIDRYIHKHSGVDFSHTICPKCMKKNYPDEYAAISQENESDES